MKVKVNITTGDEYLRSLDMDFEAESTILDVKIKIEDLEGVPAATQKLFFAHDAEEELGDDMFLAESEDSVENEDILTLVLPLETRGYHVKCLIEFKPWNGPKLDQEQFIQLINDLPVVTKVTVDIEENSSGESLRLKVSRKGSKFIETKEWIDKILEGLRRQVYQVSDVDLDYLKYPSRETEDNLKNLMTFLKKEDNVTFNIKYQNEEDEKKELEFSDTLIPCSSRKLQQLEDKTRKLINAEFQKNLKVEPTTDADITLFLANNIEQFGTGDIEKLGKDIKENALSPYILLVNRYTEKEGTIGGLLQVLDKFPDDCEISEHKLKELRDYLLQIRNREFNNWRKSYKADFNIPHVLSYRDFQHKLDCGYKPIDIMERYGKNWKELQKDIKEGDQIWMWRRMASLFEYAHVGILLNDDEGSMVHVTPKYENLIGRYLAYSGKIRKKIAKAVVGNSKCFLIRCEGTNLNGTIRERALRCVDLEFTFSSTTGNCEVFANCVAQGIYTTKKATVQGGGVVAAAVDSTKTKNQIQELLNKLAALLKDNNNVAIFRVGEQRRLQEVLKDPLGSGLEEGGGD